MSTLTEIDASVKPERGFNNLEELEYRFRSGRFRMPQAFSVAGVKYEKLSGSSKTWMEILDGKKSYLVYTAGKQHRPEVKERRLLEWVVFVWVIRPRHLTVVPLAVRTTNEYRLEDTLAKISPVREQEEKDPNLIGDAVLVKIINLPSSGALKGKVDTGASVCSLHADRWKINGDNVDFVSPDLSPNVITAPLADHQAVRSSDGGTEYRPVIELNIKINDKLINSVMFNLNDRGQMDFPILIGKNALEKSSFLIDPKMVENVDDIDWAKLDEEFKDIVIPDTDTDTDKIDAAFKTLQELDITFDDLFRHVRTEALEVMEDIEY